MTAIRTMTRMVLPLVTWSAIGLAQSEPPPISRLPSPDIEMRIEPSTSAPAEQVPACPDVATLRRWFTPIGQIEAKGAASAADRPLDCASNLFASGTGTETTVRSVVHPFWWQSPELWHQPLYFDDVPLERYGQTMRPLLQPAISAGRFFVSIPAIPYKLFVDRPFSMVTEFGKHRPGSCNPCIRQLVR